MKFNRMAVLVPALAALAVPGTAAAATATSNAADGMRYTGTSAADNPRITLAGGTFTIDDSGPVQAGAGCAAVPGDATKVTCVAFKNGSQFEVQLGDGNDSVVNLTTAPMFANGAIGADTLTGSAKARDELVGGSGGDVLRDDGGTLNVLNGGSGADSLLGGSSTDRLNGGPANDVLDGRGADDQLDGGSGADHIDGGVSGTTFGERHDLVLYHFRTAPLKVDLHLTGPQAGAEGDTLVDVEDVWGGDGDDTLIGNIENNRLFGGDGDDSLLGEEGLDHLDGGAGADGLFASPDDGFFGIVPDGFADIVDCSGPGESVNPGDFAFRELADDDLVNKCAHVFDA
jgi:Ca2+-binding RTX toxin-like protein